MPTAGKKEWPRLCCEKGQIDLKYNPEEYTPGTFHHNHHRQSHFFREGRHFPGQHKFIQQLPGYGIIWLQGGQAPLVDRIIIRPSRINAKFITVLHLYYRQKDSPISHRYFSMILIMS